MGGPTSLGVVPAFMGGDLCGGRAFMGGLLACRARLLAFRAGGRVHQTDNSTLVGTCVVGAICGGRTFMGALLAFQASCRVHQPDNTIFVGTCVVGAGKENDKIDRPVAS